MWTNEERGTWKRSFLKVFWCDYLCTLICFSCVQLCVTPWTVAHQAPLSMGFSRQEHWSGLPFPLPGDLPNPGIEPASLASPALAGGFFTTALPGKPWAGTGSQTNPDWTTTCDAAVLYYWLVKIVCFRHQTWGRQHYHYVMNVKSFTYILAKLEDQPISVAAWKVGGLIGKVTLSLTRKHWLFPVGLHSSSSVTYSAGRTSIIFIHQQHRCY